MMIQLKKPEQKELCSGIQTETALPPTLKTCILKFNSFTSLLNPPAQFIKAKQKSNSKKHIFLIMNISYRNQT